MPPRIEKEYIYHHYRGTRYMGTLNGLVTSPFKLDTAINTYNSFIDLELAVDFENLNPGFIVEELVTDDGEVLVTEDNEELVVSSEYDIQGIPNLGDRIKVVEFSSFHPSGLTVFDGLVFNFRGKYQASTTTMTIMSWGIQFDNFLVQNLPNESVAESTDIDSSVVLHAPYKTALNRVIRAGQIFQLATTTTVDTVRLYIENQGTVDVPVKLEIVAGTPTNPGAVAAVVTRLVPPQAMTATDFTIAVPVSITGSTDYFMQASNAGYSNKTNQDVYIGTDSAAGYAGGAMYQYNDMSGWTISSSDFTFSINSPTGALGNQFNSVTSSEMVQSLMRTFAALGGLPALTDDSIDPSSYTVSYTFKFSTYAEALQKAVELSPANWWYFVDPATNVVYLKSRSSVVDHWFRLRKHIVDIDIEYTLEQMANKAYLSGGDTGGGVNLLVSATNDNSVAAYGHWLQTTSDNRVTDEDTAATMVRSIIEEKSSPRWYIECIISGETYDIASLRVGDVVVFQNANDILNSLQLQIMSKSLTPEYARLSLNLLPPSIRKRIEDINRNLKNQETENNPSD